MRHEFVEGQQRPFEVLMFQVVPFDESFERLGYDAVSRSLGGAFECSPLTRDHMAEEIPVNRYCLVDDSHTAFRLPARFEAERCKPGPYHVVEVWRLR
jgi:hypothetical protein